MRVHPSLSGGRFPATSLPDLKPEPAYSTAEYQERLARARAAMDAQGLDALVVMNPASVFYLSGYQTFAVDGGACLVVTREAEPALEILQQVDDLGLNGHVQGRNRLVRHDELGGHRQRPGEADALALSPGQGLGPPLEMVGGHGDHVEQLGHALPALAGVLAQSLNAQRLAQYFLHRHVRIERAVRILKHDLRLAPEPAQRFRAESRHVLAAEAYDSAGGLDEPQQRAPDRGLSRAGFPGDAEHLVRIDRERYVVDRLHVGDRPRNETPHDREPLPESFHLDERCFGVHWSPASEMARQRQHRTR